MTIGRRIGEVISRGLWNVPCCLLLVWDAAIMTLSVVVSAGHVLAQEEALCMFRSRYLMYMQVGTTCWQSLMN